MKRSIFLFALFIPTLANASPTNLMDSLLDEIAEEIFLSPSQKELTEITKRVQEKNREDLAKIRTTLKFYLKTEKSLSSFKTSDPVPKQKLNRSLEGIPNLGGLLWYSDGKIIYSFGDWSDFYEDGLSLSKIRKEGQLAKFFLDGDEFYFFVKNTSGYFPVDFQFLGWESNFYVFGDDGSLRYTNDSKIDQSIRIGDFKKILETIKRKILNCEMIVLSDLTLIVIPGTARPLYFVLFGFRVFIYFWAVYLSYLFLTATFPFLKKNLLKVSPPQK